MFILMMFNYITLLRMLISSNSLIKSKICHHCVEWYSLSLHLLCWWFIQNTSYFVDKSRRPVSYHFVTENLSLIHMSSYLPLFLVKYLVRLDFLFSYEFPICKKGFLLVFQPKLFLFTLLWLEFSWFCLDFLNWHLCIYRVLNIGTLVN